MPAPGRKMLSRDHNVSSERLDKMIKVAIAGTNGLAQLIAHYLATNTSHQFIILSRHANAGLTAKGWQVLTVNYNNSADLQYKLAGVDTVISTICGPAQIKLIDAAAKMHVRRFMPSEFEGSPAARAHGDPLDHGRRAALARLQHYAQQGMVYSVLTCGLFYERFGPGGMAASQIGLNSGIAGEGQFMMDFKNMRAQIPLYNSLGEEVYVCMTGARDVARYVVAALDLPSWPREMRLRGDRLSVSGIVATAQQAWGGQAFEVAQFTPESLQHELLYARALEDRAREKRAQHLIATAEGRYDFANPNLNQALATQPKRFGQWLYEAWSTQ